MIPAVAPITANAPVQSGLQDMKSAERPDLRKAAEAFEAVFLTEMLAHAGMGASGGGGNGEDFSGGVGEDAFASLLTREWATRLTAEGGIGLSDAIYQALLQRGS